MDAEGDTREKLLPGQTVLATSDARRVRRRRLALALLLSAALSLLLFTLLHRPMRFAILRAAVKATTRSSDQQVAADNTNDRLPQVVGVVEEKLESEPLFEDDTSGGGEMHITSDVLILNETTIELPDTDSPGNETFVSISGGQAVDADDLFHYHEERTEEEAGTIKNRFGTIRRAQVGAPDRYNPFWNRTKELIHFHKDKCGCRRILLIIIFNHDHYDNVPFIHTLYGSVFCNIVHYGPQASELYEVRRALDGSAGAHQQKTIAQAYREFPDYDGYLWSGDDVLINVHRMFGQFHRLAVRNIWLQDYQDGQKVDLADLPQTWAWEHPFNKSTSSDVLVHAWHERLPWRFKQRQQQVFGGEYMVGVGSDMGHIPREFMPDFAQLSDLFPTLSFEIFIPTAARLLSMDTSRVQALNGLYLWADVDRVSWFKKYNIYVHDFVHPVKLSRFWSREEVERITNFSWSPPPGIC